jgi:hypothetical protein
LKWLILIVCLLFVVLPIDPRHGVYPAAARRVGLLRRKRRIADPAAGALRI